MKLRALAGIAAAAVFGIGLFCLPLDARAQSTFLRADFNLDGSLDVSDPVRTLRFLFVERFVSTCFDAGDANDDGEISLPDAVYTLRFLFDGGPPPAAPFPACGEDPTFDALDCQESPRCPRLGPPLPPSVEAPASPTRETQVALRAAAGAGVVEIEVAGGLRTAVAPVGEDGTATIEVELVPNRANRLFGTAIDAKSRRSAPATALVVHDATPPQLFIDEPAGGASIAAETATVTGRVSDLLSGFLGLEVEVQSSPSEAAPQPANVVIGIGTNGTYERPAVPLALGENRIAVSAVDAAGNVAVREITVTRTEVSTTLARLEIVSGNGQSAAIHEELAAPIVARALTPDGSPLTGKVLSFQVARSDGRLAAAPVAAPDERVRLLQVRTDAEGRAAAYWALGSDAGCGNNRVVVSGTGLANEVVFCASAAPGAAAQINVGSGNNQRAEAGVAAPEPLRAWVNDSCNGVAGVAVRFRVVAGGGQVGGASEVTVTTGPTGHAEVRFVLGSAGGTQLVEADFEGNRNRPASFAAFGIVRNASRPTSFSGIVLDNAGQPLEGAVCALRVGAAPLVETSSDAGGQFRFGAIEGSGRADLFIDGLAVSAAGGMPKPPGSYAALRYDLVLVPNADNSLGTPVLLPPLDPRNARSYSNTGDTELGVEGVEGLTMVIKAGSMRLPSGEPAPEGTVVSLNQVHHDDVPMPMPDGAAPPFAWTLQPGGATFDPPVAITYPNMSGLPPGAIAYFLSFNHDTSRFEIVASGHVSEDGANVFSDPGAGLTLAGWGCNCPPYSVTGDCEDDPCEDSKDFLNDNCESTRGSGAGALNCQLACLANNACNDDSPDWVRCTINDYADNRRRGNHGPGDGICRYVPSWVPLVRDPVTGQWFTGGDICFAVDGTAHLLNELVPSWTRKCDQIGDGEHNAFLFGTLVPCLLTNPDINSPFDLYGSAVVPIVANIARELIQAGCGDGGGQGIAAPPRPTREQLFSQDLAAASRLEVTAGEAFFIGVGQSAQLRVLRREKDGSVTDLSAAASGTLYFAAIAAPDGSERELVSIGADGLMTVHETPSPFAALTVPFVVAVRNGDDLGVGQFAIEDQDGDGDGLIDSYEERSGLDPADPATPGEDGDGDALRELAEALLGTHPRQSDTDGDGVEDGAEVRQGSDPRDPRSSLPSFSLPPLGFVAVGGGGAAEDCEPSTEHPIVTVNGQSVTVEHDGSFKLANVAAPDLFGPGGPGTRPDFLSDDFLRVKAVFTRGCKTYYAFSDPFQISQGETFRVRDLVVTDVPPPFPESIRIEADAVLLDVGATAQLRVIATLGTGEEIDVSRRTQWTIYRTSNAATASVAEDGLVTANGAGTVFITAVNEAATAVKRLVVAEATVATTAEGRVVLEDGSPVADAVVRSPFEDSASTDALGAFSMALRVPQGRSLSLSASASIAGERFSGAVRGLRVIPDGITDAGDIVLRPGLSGDWTARAALPTSRGALTAVTLGDGIHVLGGDVNWNGSSPFNVHEVYDPASDTWSTRAVVPDSNTWSARAAVVGEKIYLLGGWPGGSNLNREYDPERNEWTYKAPIPAIFTWGHAVAALGNEIVVIGGTCGFCVQIYDAAQDSWRQGASIPGNRASLAAAAIGERIYVAGTGAQLQIYDPAADEWTTGADLPVSTHAPSAAVFVDKLYLFGGSSSDPGSGGNLSAVQVYDPVEDRWEELPSMPTPRSWSAAAAVEDAIHVFGGFNTANTRIDVHERMR